MLLDVHKLEKTMIEMTNKNALLAFVAGALISFVLSLSAGAQTLPGVTTGEPGMCGIATNTCKVGDLGDNSAQYSALTGELVGYHWYCNGSNGGARSPLCFTTVTAPTPTADPMLGAWEVALSNGRFRDGYNGSSHSIGWSSTAIVLDTVTDRNNDAASYKGYLPAYPGSEVYLNQYGLSGPMPAAQLFLVFREVGFFQGPVQYVVNIDLSIPGQYGWGMMSGIMFSENTGARAGYIGSEADFYRSNGEKGEPSRATAKLQLTK